MSFLLFIVFLILLQQSYSILSVLLVSELVWFVFLVKTNVLAVLSNNPEVLLFIFILLALASVDLALGLSIVIVQNNVFNFLDSSEFSFLKKKKKLFFSNSTTLQNKLKF
jgi:NADH:ubiquinone oxidoreductase subunit K